MDNNECQIKNVATAETFTIQKGAWGSFSKVGNKTTFEMVDENDGPSTADYSIPYKTDKETSGFNDKFWPGA